MTTICVLGMHRSGTSVVAQLLSALGVQLGPAGSLLSPSGDNPAGFWEHNLIRELNDEILKTVGGSWHDPPNFPPGWETGVEFEDFESRAEHIVRGDFAGAEFWGWKDPRTCLTLRFWQRFVPNMRYVICLRRPIDVARSLQRRNGFSIERGIYLWLTYMQAAIQATSGKATHLVNYEDLMQDPQAVARNLREFVGTPIVSRGELTHLVESIVQPQLRHHRTTFGQENVRSSSDVSLQALGMAQEIHDDLNNKEFALSDDRLSSLERTLDQLRPVIRVEVTSADQADEAAWALRCRQVLKEIRILVPAGGTLLLVDEDRLGIYEHLAGQGVMPFVEHNGRYWGPPADDRTAIGELQRQQERSAAVVIAFCWPAFWWLDYYAGLHQYLRDEFTCVEETDRMIAFAWGKGDDAE